MTEATPIQISLGFNINNSTGAANNSLLYLDNVRVLKKEGTGIQTTVANAESSAVYRTAFWYAALATPLPSPPEPT